MPGYQAVITHNVVVRGLDNNQTRDDSIAELTTTESFTGVTDYQVMHIQLPGANCAPVTGYGFQFDSAGMTRLALVFIRTQDDVAVPQSEVWYTTGGGALTTALLTGKTTFMKFDNRLISITGNSDGFLFTVSGGTGTTFSGNLAPGSGTNLSVYDIVSRLNAAAAVSGAPVTFSVADSLGIRAEVTGSTGRTIMVRAPTGTTLDIRLMLFGSTATPSENMTDGDNAYEGRIMTRYSPSNIIIALKPVSLVDKNFVRIVAIGAQ